MCVHLTSGKSDFKDVVMVNTARYRCVFCFSFYATDMTIQHAFTNSLVLMTLLNSGVSGTFSATSVTQRIHALSRLAYV